MEFYTKLSNQIQTSANFSFIFFRVLGVGVLLEKDEAFHDGRVSQVLLGCELRPLAVGQKYGRRVRLKARDALGLAGLTDDVDGLADAN